MLTHTTPRGRAPGRPASLIAVIGALSLLLFAVSCDKVPLLAPTGSVISLFATAVNVPLNGEITIVATVIENGAAAAAPAAGAGAGAGTTTTTRAGAGTPVQNGTLVSFTTTIGRIEPAEARTHNGQVSVRFISGGQSGTARITAFSGGASGTLENLLVGSAAARRLTLTANPQSLGSNGGSTEIIARVEDDAGTALPGVPVTFTTSAGSLSPTSTTTDSSGVARTTLTSTTAAEVTATSGAQMGRVSVTVAARSGLAVTASPQSTNVGTPVTFAITTAAGAAITDAVIDYGDGSRPRPLGTITGARSDQHVYSQAGGYTVTVTGRGPSGTSESAGTAVTVGSLPVTLTASPSTTTPNSPVTFTVGGVAGAQVDHYEWAFDDGVMERTSGPQNTHAFGSRGNHTARVTVIAPGGGSIGSASAVVVIAGA